MTGVENTILEAAEREALRSDVKEAVARGDAGLVLAACRQLMDGSSNPGDVFFCSAQMNKVREPLLAMDGMRCLRTYVVRSVTVEPMMAHMRAEALLAGYLLEVEIGGFGSYAEELMNPEGSLGRFEPDLVLVVFDLEDAAGRLPELCCDGVGDGVEDEISGCVERMSQLLRGLRSFSKARIVMQGFVVPDRSSLGDVGDANVRFGLACAVQRINEQLARACGALQDCVFFDVDRLAARCGRAGWTDARLFLSSRLAVAPGNFVVYTKGLVRAVNVLFRAPRKVLCTDLDNTLWGGVLGEEGADGIATGSTYPGTPYFRYQQYLKQLSSRGVLLAIASKNDEAEVREAFELRAADLALGMGDFAGLKIRWTEKVDSLRELSRELGLGLESFVLVDDNPVECEAVRRQLPEVAVVQAPVEEPWRLVEMLADERFFDALRVTEDDRNRASEYKAQAKRAELECVAGGREEFLASLGIVCRFESAMQAPLARAVQLLAKTNQFNLTTRRYGAADVEEFVSRDGREAIAVRVRDRFGDAGVVGLALARYEGDACRIDSFLLSCRVIGRGIETALLTEISERALRRGAGRLVGEFVPSRRNAVCASFYTDHGFVERSGDGGESRFYDLDLCASTPRRPKWIGLEGVGSDEVSPAALVSR